MANQTLLIDPTSFMSSCMVIRVNDIACKTAQEVIEARLLPVVRLGSVDLALSLVTLGLVSSSLGSILLLLFLKSLFVLLEELLLLLLILMLLFNDLPELASLLLLSLVSEDGSLLVDLFLLVSDRVDAVDVAIEILLGRGSSTSKDSLHTSKIAIEGSHCLSISSSLVVETCLLHGSTSHPPSYSWGDKILWMLEASMYNTEWVSMRMSMWICSSIGSCSCISGLGQSWSDLGDQVLDSLVWQHVTWESLQVLVQGIKLLWKHREILGHLTELGLEWLGER